MTELLRKVFCTAQLSLYAVLPASRCETAAGDGVREAGVLRCSPKQIRGGMSHLVNREGELRLFFPHCLAISAAAILFRLKREGYSCCSVEASGRGLLVRGRR